MQNKLIEIQSNTGVYYTIDKQAILDIGENIRKHTVDISEISGTDYSVAAYYLGNETVNIILENGVDPICLFKYGSTSKLELIELAVLHEKFSHVVAEIVCGCLEVF